MTLTKDDLNTMRQALVDLQSNIDESGPCDHPVNICVCGQRATLDALATLFYHLSKGQVGYRKPSADFDMVDFARDLLHQTNVERLSQLKAEADARNPQFRKGTIND